MRFNIYAWSTIMRLGIVAGSFKPYHAGHHKMVEIAAGVTNLTLMSKNLLDGLALSGRLGTHRRQPRRS